MERTQYRRGTLGARSPAEEAVALVFLAQHGDVTAQHRLAELFQSLIGRTVARYGRDAALFEELPGQVRLIFHRLILEFEVQRGVSLFTYLERKLPKALWSYVRQQRTVARRAAGPRRPGEEGGDENDLGRTLDWAARTAGGLRAGVSVERVAIERILLQGALRGLTQRQREVFDLWAAGHTSGEIAAILKIDPAACRQALRRARAHLQEALTKSF